jgi:hypothetical protein
MSVRAAGAPAAIAQSKSQWRASTGAPVQSTRRLDKVLAIGFAKITLNHCAKTSMMEPAPGDLTPDDQASADIQLDQWLDDVLTNPPDDQLPTLTFRTIREDDELDELVEAGALDDIAHEPDSAPVEGEELVDALHDEFLGDFEQHGNQLDESVVSPNVPSKSQKVPGSSSEKSSTTGGNMDRYTQRQLHILEEFFTSVKGMDAKLPKLRREEIESLLMNLNDRAEDKVANEIGVRDWLNRNNALENNIRKRGFRTDADAEEHVQRALTVDVNRAWQDLLHNKLTQNAKMNEALESLFLKNYHTGNVDIGQIRQAVIKMAQIEQNMLKKFPRRDFDKWWELRMAYQERRRRYEAHFQDQGSSQDW